MHLKNIERDTLMVAGKWVVGGNCSNEGNVPKHQIVFYQRKRKKKKQKKSI